MEIKVDNIEVQNWAPPGKSEKGYGKGSLVIHPDGAIQYISKRIHTGRFGYQMNSHVTKPEFDGAEGRVLSFTIKEAKSQDVTAWQITRWKFRCRSKTDAEAFGAAVKNAATEWHERDRVMQSQLGFKEAIKTRLVEEGKVGGRIKLQPFVKKHRPYATVVWGEDLSETRFNLVIVEGYITQLIVDGTLNGILDKEKHVYTDKELIVRTQRIIKIEMDFNQLLSQLGNKGIALTSIECPDCGGNCEMPESGAMFTCKYCSATIQAVDVFEKFKSFLE